MDHIAFKASGAADFRKRLKKLGIEFEEQNIENAGYQVFLYDPVGTKLEFNFLNERFATRSPSAPPLRRICASAVHAQAKKARWTAGFLLGVPAWRSGIGDK